MEGGTKGHKTSLPGVKTMKKQPGHLPQTTHLRSSPGEDGTLLPIPFWRSCVLSEDTGDGQRKCWVSPHLCSFVPMFLLFTKQWPKERGLAPAGGNSPSAWMAPAGVSRLSHPHAAPFSPAPQHRSTPSTRPTWGQTPSTDPSPVLQTHSAATQSLPALAFLPPRLLCSSCASCSTPTHQSFIPCCEAEYSPLTSASGSLPQESRPHPALVSQGCSSRWRCWV